MQLSYRVIPLVILLSLVLNHTAAKPSKAPAASQLTKASETALLNVTVRTKKGKLVTGLTQSNFEILIDNKPASIVSFSNADLPASVGIVLDSSGSMGGFFKETTRRNFLAIREALTGFLEISNPENEYFLLGFNYKPQLLLDWTSDHSAVMEKFDHLNVDGNSAFYDACYLAVDKLHGARNAKRVLILISDGQDNKSRYTFNELREYLRNSNVLLYAISFASSFDPGSVLGADARSILYKLSTLSGGVAFYINKGVPLNSEDASTVIEVIANELRNQYLISIASDEGGERKKWRKLKVKINLPSENAQEAKRVEVRTRKGVY